MIQHNLLSSFVRMSCKTYLSFVSLFNNIQYLSWLHLHTYNFVMKDTFFSVPVLFPVLFSDVYWQTSEVLVISKLEPGTYFFFFIWKLRLSLMTFYKFSHDLFIYSIPYVTNRFTSFCNRTTPTQEAQTRILQCTIFMQNCTRVKVHLKFISPIPLHEIRNTESKGMFT